jgi:hypothetical protein
VGSPVISKARRAALSQTSSRQPQSNSRRRRTAQVVERKHPIDVRPGIGRGGGIAVGQIPDRLARSHHHGPRGTAWVRRLSGAAAASHQRQDAGGCQRAGDSRSPKHHGPPPGGSSAPDSRHRERKHHPSAVACLQLLHSGCHQFPPLRSGVPLKLARGYDRNCSRTYVRAYANVRSESTPSIERMFLHVGEESSSLDRTAVRKPSGGSKWSKS